MVLRARSPSRLGCFFLVCFFFSVFRAILLEHIAAPIVPARRIART
jgi:hypothetical protein